MSGRCARLKLRALRVAALLVLWLAGARAFATTSLSFEGGGYWIDMELGADRDPAIASIRFHEPGDPRGVVLPRAQWHMDTFEARQQRLLLRHEAGNSGVPPFVLSVRRQRATLTIAGRRVESAFNWSQ